MKERVLKKNQVIEILIKDMAFNGQGLGKIETVHGEFAVFVQNTFTGQLVKARVVKSADRYAECQLIEILTPSPVEITIPYQSIPGAPYATMPIELQHEYKKRNTLELFKRIAKMKEIDTLLDEYIASPSAWHYRNKMEYSFSAIRYDFNLKKDVDDFAFGFKHRGTWWCVENLEKDSGLFDAEFENLLPEIRQWAIETGLPAWHAPRHEGFFQLISVRKCFNTDQLLVNLITSNSHIEHFSKQSFCDLLTSKLGNRIAGILHTINLGNQERANQPEGQTTLLFGDDTLVEKINELEFEISVKSFFQTNPRCAEKLYDKVIEYAESANRNNESFTLDLFCGTGTISQLLHKGGCKNVIGVDIVESAINDARKNAKRNNLEGVEFIAADVGAFLSEHPEYKGKIATIVLDPPRAGIAPKSLQKIIALGAHSIVYVSCNPATMTRDAADLETAGYNLKKLSLVDQFPHTAHIEAIGLFTKIPT